MDLTPDFQLTAISYLGEALTDMTRLKMLGVAFEFTV